MKFPIRRSVALLYTFKEAVSSCHFRSVVVSFHRIHFLGIRGARDKINGDDRATELRDRNARALSKVVAPLRSRLLAGNLAFLGCVRIIAL